jgi:sec-independent protein translocase protein TatA
MIGFTEILIIAAIILVVLFGGKKIVEVARGMGRFSSEFKKGKMEAEKELNEMKGEIKEENKSN